MALTAIELKFLLRLLGHQPNFRTVISAIKLNAKTPAAERDHICMVLCSQGLVDYTYEVNQFAIAPAGRTLLKLDNRNRLVTPQELAVLKGCRKGTISPGKLTKVSPQDRQWLIRGLEDRGLVVVKKTQIKEVWLTIQGRQFLRDDLAPTGNSPSISGKLLNYYVQFLRQALGTSVSSGGTGARDEAVDSLSEQGLSQFNPTDLLPLIQSLDQQLSTDNYLPIFHLREHLASTLTRSELDDCLYDLQRQDKIELSTLQDVSAYSDQQLAAGARRP